MARSKWPWRHVYFRAADIGINFQMQCGLSVGGSLPRDRCPPWRKCFALHSDDRVRNKMEQGELSSSQKPLRGWKNR